MCIIQLQSHGISIIFHLQLINTALRKHTADDGKQFATWYNDDTINSQQQNRMTIWQRSVTSSSADCFVGFSFFFGCLSPLCWVVLTFCNICRALLPSPLSTLPHFLNFRHTNLEDWPDHISQADTGLSYTRWVALSYTRWVDLSYSGCPFIHWLGGPFIHWVGRLYIHWVGSPFIHWVGG